MICKMRFVTAIIVRKSCETKNIRRAAAGRGRAAVLIVRQEHRPARLDWLTRYRRLAAAVTAWVIAKGIGEK
jgi:hypothetical protein